MTEVIVDANGAALCAEPFGKPTDPPILLVAGLGASMLWWDEGFCRTLAEAGRFVIRYDHRDTGRSTTCEPGHPDYGAADLVDDAAGVLDAFGLEAAHVVGASAGGAMAQLLALGGDRVLSLVLISTSPAVPVGRRLPPPTEEFLEFVAGAEVDWTDRASVIEYLVRYARLLAGERPFDEARWRALARRDVERADGAASLLNHDVIAHDHDGPHPPLSSILAPTLVIHGTADPMFPVEHGRALADEIPNAAFLELDGAGHGVDGVDWIAVGSGIIAHTATAREGTGLRPPRRTGAGTYESFDRGAGGATPALRRAPEDERYPLSSPTNSSPSRAQV